jgi:hypothetical protein
MERVVHKAKSFQAATDWDIQQHISMSPQERMRAALDLKRRAYPKQTKDVRECHRNS